MAATMAWVDVAADLPKLAMPSTAEVNHRYDMVSSVLQLRNVQAAATSAILRATGRRASEDGRVSPRTQRRCEGDG
jgi:hypothetical protein